MNKADLINYVAAEASVTKKEAKSLIETVITGIIEGLTADGKVTLVGFGTFSLAARAARLARNPKTGESVDVPAKVVPKFRASVSLKEVFEDFSIGEEAEEAETEE
jgi:DNA-binding protein HU-beta